MNIIPLRIPATDGFDINDYHSYPYHLDIPNAPPQMVAHHFDESTHGALVMLLKAGFGSDMFPDIERGYQLYDIVKEQLAKQAEARPISRADVEAEYWHIVRVLSDRRG